MPQQNYIVLEHPAEHAPAIRGYKRKTIGLAHDLKFSKYDTVDTPNCLPWPTWLRRITGRNLRQRR